MTATEQHMLVFRRKIRDAMHERINFRGYARPDLLEIVQRGIREAEHELHWLHWAGYVLSRNHAWSNR